MNEFIYYVISFMLGSVYSLLMVFFYFSHITTKNTLYKNKGDEE